MNTQQQQAELYRKAAETIEMCAEHGIDAKVKVKGNIFLIFGFGFTNPFDCYEFPLAVIEGQLVWADTVVYNRYGDIVTPKLSMHDKYAPYTITQPKQPLCKVEGKPIYKGDNLYHGAGQKFMATSCDGTTIFGLSHDSICRWSIDNCSWSKPKRTVMVELSIERAAIYAAVVVEDELVTACRKALNNLKGQ